MLRTFFVSVLLLFSSLALHAQGSNLFIGYSYLSADSPAGDHANLNGWNGSLEGKIFPFVGIVADVSGHYGQQTIFSGCGQANCSPFDVSTQQHAVVFGPRVSVSVGKIRPFAHFLVGAAHVSLKDNGSDTSFAETIGGGVDYKVLPLIALRLQGDFLQTRFFDGTQDDFRFSTGLVFHF